MLVGHEAAIDRSPSHPTAESSPGSIDSSGPRSGIRRPARRSSRSADSTSRRCSPSLSAPTTGRSRPRVRQHGSPLERAARLDSARARRPHGFGDRCVVQPRRLAPAHAERRRHRAALEHTRDGVADARPAAGRRSARSPTIRAAARAERRRRRHREAVAHGRQPRRRRSRRAARSRTRRSAGRTCSLPARTARQSAGARPTGRCSPRTRTALPSAQPSPRAGGVMTAGDDGIVRSWTPGGSSSGRRRTASRSRPLAVSHDGPSRGRAPTARPPPARQRRGCARCRVSRSGVTSIAFSATDGAGGGATTTPRRIWNSRTGQPCTRSLGHTLGSPRLVQPRGKLVLTSSRRRRRAYLERPRPE